MVQMHHVQIGIHHEVYVSIMTVRNLLVLPSAQDVLPCNPCDLSLIVPIQ